MKRSEFISTFFRVSILFSITALVGFFAFGKKISMDSECSESNQCKACGKLNKCSLPEANRYRSNG